MTLPLKQRLKRHYTATLAQSFRQFRWGASIFLAGLVMIYAASQLMAPSLAQEVAVLVGLVIVGTGFVIAIAAQFRMLMGRLIRFWEKR